MLSTFQVLTHTYATSSRDVGSENFQHRDRWRGGIELYEFGRIKAEMKEFGGEEIKRLLVLASEEAARVELQAAEKYGYDYGYRYESLKDDDEVFVETPASLAALPTF
ncbi:hypothetical protein MTR67_005054 [Solanum verrucosum]|uniref:Uncharacterized protein n=1 Tax=Solanum verrucosum TaxID=315347 RepID=A0AAF0PV41_SOLVR|nr:hypothetical protein MTR67_005054 [Solanum verrucosum]